MRTDALESEIDTLHASPVFGLTRNQSIWEAVCLRCGQVVAQNPDLNEIKVAEALHQCGQHNVVDE